MIASLSTLLDFWISMFAGSGLLIVVVIAILFSIFRVPLPKKRPGEPSWFPDEKKYGR